MTRKRTEALAIYRKLVLVRRAEERIIAEYAKDEIKTPVHLGVGLEGISVGVAHVLPPKTKAFGQFRNHGQYLSMGGDLDAFFAELYGRVTGTGGGKAGSMHLCAPAQGFVSTSAVVASTIPLAVGAALAARYRGTEDVVVAQFGDAAIEEGEFWDSLNFACLHKVRILFVCEDNGLAVHTFARERRGFTSIPAAVRGFDCHVDEGDGTDARVVTDVTRRMLSTMARDPKPGFLCFTWYRPLEHCGPNTDFHVGYRPRPTDAELLRADPVHNYEQALLAEGFSRTELDAIRSEIDAQIERSVRAARQAPFPGLRELHEDVFA